MKKEFYSIAALIGILIMFPSSVYAQNYTLKRAVITWEGGLIDDSLVGTFGASGTMSINGNRIVQDITFCEFGTCDHVVVNSGGTVTSVAKNAAKVTIKLDDGSIGDITLLTLSPNIITLYAYDDGTVETHEWEPTAPFAKRLEKETGNALQTGILGRGIADKLRQ